MPKISVVMPAYNAEKYIAEAIDSILNQTFADFDFIIIDDCSSDRTAEIVKSYTDPRIRFYQNEHNMGVAATLNRGLDLATGEYIARMDSDDISYPERFEKQFDFMENNPEIAVLGAGIQMFSAKIGERLFSESYNELKIDLLFASCFAHPAVMLRSKYFGNGKLEYDLSFNKMEDFDLWDRTAIVYPIASFPEVLLKYRIHPNQITQNYDDEYKKQLQMLKIRQISRLGLDNTASEFESYFSFCEGKFDTSSDNIYSLARFFNLIEEKNKSVSLYNEVLLKSTFKSIIKGLIEKLPLKESFFCAARCGISPIIYIAERTARGLISKLVGGIQKKKLQSKLKSKDFTIISNNCWGSFEYQKFGLKYMSPTVGLYFLGHDFVKLAANWEHYFSCKLEFIPWEECSYYYALKTEIPYPVAKLDDIEVYFMHYASEEEAAEKWYRRTARINKERILFKLSQREGCSKEDIEEFMALSLKNKLCFAYDKVPGTIYVPELEGLVGDEQPIVSRYVDDISVLNGL